MSELAQIDIEGNTVFINGRRYDLQSVRRALTDINQVIDYLIKEQARTSEENIINVAKKAGIVASFGKNRGGQDYKANVNALGKHVPYEWLEKFAIELLKD